MKKHQKNKNYIKMIGTEGTYNSSRPKLYPILHALCRCFEENEQDIKLECNTEKDKAISHHRPAGIKL